MDHPSNVEFQSLLEAESILDDLEIDVPIVDVSASGGRDLENYLRHDLGNYHTLLDQVRARASSVRTIETAALILRSRFNRRISAMLATT